MLPEMRNVVQLGGAFFFIILAFNSQTFIQNSVIASAAKSSAINKSAAYYSQALVYFVCTFGNFVAAPIVDVISAKWAMFLGSVCYCLFMAGFLALNEVYLYTSSALMGFGAALLWNGQGAYLAKNCDERTSGRNASVLWTVFQGSLIAGGTFILIVYETTGTTDAITTSTRMIMYSVFASLAVLGTAVIALLPAPPQYLEQKTKDLEKKGWTELTIKTFRLMFTQRIFVLAPTFMYIGMMNSFWAGIYPACMSNDHGNQSLVAVNAIVSGIGQCSAGLLIGFLASRSASLKRPGIVFMGAMLHMFAFIIIFILFLQNANIHLEKPVELKPLPEGHMYIKPVVPPLAVGFLLGFGDACWNTQIYAHLVANFPDASAQAFALFKFYKSALSCATFYAGSQIPVVWLLLIMLVLSIVAATAFALLEHHIQQQKKKDSPKEPNFDTVEERE